ncbi:hypothetical protein [Butyricimonas sp. Marseille-P3923]|uniref:hypothetical protein n=1 Tax=Butyricimonas sp. Marseille-P3923 TaxID=1987504 RepID=UPI000C06EE7E|nr:hypothetical protein [Butyricimonas sp. Marseille-P3923]
MKSLVLKSFLALVFFMGSAMINAPIKDIYYGACDVYPEGFEFSIITQPKEGNFKGEIEGNRFLFTCESPGVYKILFYAIGYEPLEQTFTIQEDDTGINIYGDIRLNEMTLDD